MVHILWLLLSTAGSPQPAAAPACLWEAARTGALGRLEQLLWTGMDPDTPDSDGTTALMQAAEAGQWAAVSQLLLHFADIDRTDHEGRTAQARLLARGDTVGAVFLLHRGARVHHPALPLPPPDVPDDPYEAAARIRPVLDLITGPTPVTADTLLACLQQGALLSIGAEESGLQPLSVAARAGRADAVAALLLLGADPRVRVGTARGATLVDPRARLSLVGPLDLARNRACADLLRDYGALDLEGFHREQLRAALFMEDLAWIDAMTDTLAYLNLDPFVPTEDGRGPLHLAAWYGRTEALTRLMHLGAEPDQVDAAGWAPLHYALIGGRVEAVKRLLDAGADPDLPGPDGAAPLPMAVSGGPGPAAMTGPHAFNPGDAAEGLPPWPWPGALRRDLVASLLDAGADPDLRDPRGTTAVMVAQGTPRILAQLLAAGADPDAEDRALAAALHGGRKSIARAAARLSAGHHEPTRRALTHLLRRRKRVPDDTTLQRLHDPTFAGDRPAVALTVLRGNAPATARLLAAGADPTGRLPHSGNTLLHLAVMADAPDTLTLLLDAGTDLNAVNLAGHTPLSLAVALGRHLQVAALLARGARRTAHALPQSLPAPAAARGDVAMLKQLRKAGISLDEAGADGRTPLMHAVLGNHPRAVRRLLHWGAHPNARAADGVTALMLAASHGHTACARKLLAGGARRDLVDGNKQDALALARSAGHRETAHLLAGAD